MNLRIPATVGLLVTLSVLAAIRIGFENRIPPLPENALANHPGDYIKAAVRQPERWRPFDATTLAIAKNEGRPILLVIGNPWSGLAQAMDQQVFTSVDVANIVNDSFVAVRIDARERPRWASAYLPLSRLKAAFRTGFQCYVLDSKGRLLTVLEQPKGDSPADPVSFIDELTNARSLFRNENPRADDAILNLLQVADVFALEKNSSGPRPTFGDFTMALPTLSSGTAIGFQVNGFNRILPNAWRYQLLTGDIATLRPALDRVLLSPVTDLMRGGFFSADENSERLQVQYDKVTTQNAEMASMLADLAQVTNDPLYRQSAHDTFAMLQRDLRLDRLMYDCQMPDDNGSGRSPNASYPVISRMLNVLSFDEANWARDNLGLNVLTDPQMIPFLVSRKVLSDPRYPIVLTKLRQLSAPPPPKIGWGYADVSGLTTARMLHCARLWDDVSSQNDLLETVDLMESMRFHDDVVHSLGAQEPAPYLGDYLGYADACLEAYLSSGRLVYYDNGLAVLQRAERLFAGSKPGVWTCEPSTMIGPAPPSTNPPELTDDDDESCTAQMIRLCYSYGQLAGLTPAGNHLRGAAMAGMNRFAHVIPDTNPLLGGYFAASAMVLDPTCAFVVGPQPVETAARLARLRPLRLVAPVEGRIRPDLSEKPAGVYLVRGVTVVGPLSVEEAARRLPTRFEVGLPSVAVGRS